MPAIFSRLRFHFCERTYYFIEKKNYQEYENLSLLFLVSVQFSFRKKPRILSFSKNKNRSQKQKAEKKSKEQIRKQGIISFVKLQILLTRMTFQLISSEIYLEIALIYSRVRSKYPC